MSLSAKEYLNINPDRILFHKLLHVTSSLLQYNKEIGSRKKNLKNSKIKVLHSPFKNQSRISQSLKFFGVNAKSADPSHLGQELTPKMCIITCTDPKNLGSTFTS